MKNPLNLRWSGPLTTNNVEHVADLLRQLLKDKRITVVEAHERFGFRPKVHTGECLEEMRAAEPALIIAHREPDPPYAIVAFSVADNFWPCSTNLVDADLYDPKSGNAYFSFDNDKVTITLRNTGGEKIYWVLAVEHPDRR